MAKAGQKLRLMAKIQMKVIVGEAPLFQQVFSGEAGLPIKDEIETENVSKYMRVRAGI